MFFLITYQTAQATINDINLARQFSTKKRLRLFFTTVVQRAPSAPLRYLGRP
jgi:hypothetical protein